MQDIFTMRQPEQGRALKAWRQSLGLSHSALAVETGVSRRELIYIESGDESRGIGPQTESRLKAYMERGKLGVLELQRDALLDQLAEIQKKIREAS